MNALNAAFRENKAILTGSHKPLMELCRTLAGQMDREGANASTRLTAAYLSALKDLNRVTTGSGSAGATGSSAQKLRDELRAKREGRGRNGRGKAS
ncbi:hypothetical protein [Arthrobacter sp. HY1533]|uniref:hypothetical protein n=1 Tax=Arthrobacter sp. HY1533 TaxID=2970919 RepID=UPI0022BA08DF|nr:hypothetical protein [Arthrobacter sp. HY1533]